MDSTKVPEREPGYRAELLDGEFMLYSEAQTRAVYLNESASLVWQLIDGKRPVTEIVELLSKAYDVAPDAMREDVAGAIRELMDHGAVRWRQDG